MNPISDFFDLNLSCDCEYLGSIDSMQQGCFEAGLCVIENWIENVFYIWVIAMELNVCLYLF